MTRFEVLDAIGLFALAAAAGQEAPSPVQSQETVAPSDTMAMGIHLPTTLADWSKGARLYDGLGTYHRKISTRSPDAQRYLEE